MALEGFEVMPFDFGGGDAADISITYPLTLIVNGDTRRNPLVRLVKDDTGVGISFTIQDRDGTAIDLTTVIATFKMAKERAAANQVSGVCSLTDPTAGECTYTFVTDDLDTAGNYIAEVELDFGGGVVKSTERFRVTVLADAPYGA